MAEDLFEKVLNAAPTAADAPGANVADTEADPLFETLLDRSAQDEKRRNVLSAKAGMAAIPAQYADHLDLAKTYGVSVDFVGRNAERLQAFKGFTDLSRMLDNNAPLAKWYASEDNVAAIERDELSSLDGLKWLSASAYQAFNAGRDQVSLGDLRYRELMGAATGDEIDRANKLSAGMEPRTYGAESWLENSWVWTANQLPILGSMLMGGIERGVEGAAYGGTIAALAGQAGPQVALPEELITVPAGAATGFGVGITAGAWEQSFKLESGLMLDELLQMRDETGAKLDPDVARVAAIIGGGVSSSLETVGGLALAKVVPGLGELISAGGNAVVKEALTRPTVRLALKNFAVNLGKSSATEVSTEVLQEAVNVFSGELAKVYANEMQGADFRMISGDEVRDRLSGAFVQTLQTMTILGPALSSTRLGHDVKRARSAQRDRAVIEALGKSAEENQLNVRLPEKAKEAVRAITEGGPIQSMYVSPDVLSTYFQSAEDISAFTNTVGITAEYNEAIRLGRDMEIPLDAYYVHIAGTPIGQDLANFVKLAPDAMSFDEATVFNEAWAEAVASVQAEFTAEQQANAATLSSVDAIHQDVKTRAMDAGIVPDQAEQYAKLYANFFRVMGERTLQDAGELYGRYGFDVRRVIPGEGGQYRPVDSTDLALDVIRSGGVDRLRKKVDKSKGASLLARIKARGGLNDDGGELAAMNVPRGIRRKEAGGAEFSADDTARALWEEGYFPEFEDRPTANDLFNAIGEELGGAPRYSAQIDQSTTPEIERAAALIAFADDIDRLGLRPETMTNDEIKAELARIVNDDPDAGALYQEAARAALTDTDAFAEWFGDSKVVDDRGAPLVVYHGTRNKFEAFHPFSHFGTRKAAEDRLSSGYVRGVVDEILPVYLSIQNPLRVVDDGLSDLVALLYAVHDAKGVSNADFKRLDDYLAENGADDEFTESFASAINKAGYDGLVYENIEEDAGNDSWIALRPTQIKSINNDGSFDPNDPRILYQDTGTQPTTSGVKRGSIQIAPGRTIVNMFEAADLSTFLHESGHFFLEVFRDLATTQGAAGELMVDWQIVREYLGITDDGNIPVEAHEKWARTFEAYLFEGKAPSDEVAGIFARFRSWLVFVYQEIARLNVPINDKVRGVMDRLVATDKEIEAARKSPEFRPAFASAEEAGMSDAQYRDYLLTAGRAVDTAKREMTTRMLQDVARETTAEWREAKREIREQVTAEIQREPVYQAITYLRTGQSDMIPPGIDRIYLDRDSIVEVMGEGALQAMPRSVPPLYRAQGGQHADVVAEVFGFKSGHDMLTKMMSVRPIGRAITEEVDTRMRARFGDLMGDAVARAREASAAVANDATGDLLMIEMEVLMRKGLVNSKVRKQDARNAARALVRGKTIREAIRVKLYANAAFKAAQEAETAILAGDWKAAVAAKQRQLVNHYAAMEAREIERETESAVKYLNKFAGRKRPKGVDPDYLDQIEGLLERFDFRRSVTLKDTQRRASLAAWIFDQEANGAIVNIADELRDDAFRKPYREMSVDDLLAVRDAVKNIEHLGRLKDKLLANKEQREFEAVRDEFVTAIEASQDKRKAQKTRNPTPVDIGWDLAGSLESALLKLEQVFSWMDGGDINGPARRFVWQPIADAEVRENEMREQYAAKIAQAFDKLDKKRLNEWITIPGLDQTYQRSDIMAVALNMGNASNHDKLLRGEGWTQQTLDAVVSHLNADEARAIQEIWDTINTLWPDVVKLQRRLSGVAPEKVEAREVEIAGVKLTGGYYPMIYDPLRSADVADRQAAAADKMFENTYLRPETAHGFTKERAQRYTRPLYLNIDGVARHINGVIHDLTHREAILDANKLLTNPLVRSTIEERYGRNVYQQMVPWLQSIANDRYENKGLQAWEKLFRSVRSRTTMVAMGFRVSTMLAQFAGISSSLEQVGVKAMAGAIKDFSLAPLQSWAMVTRLSGEMRHRQQTLDRDIREKLNELTGKTGLADRARRFAFYGIGYMDRLVTGPTWLAAYREHLAQYPTDKDGAIAKADQVIRLSQGSGGKKDLAAVSRSNEGVRLLTMFYSYFSAYYNRQRTWARDAKRAVAAGEFREFPDLLARQVFMTIGPAILGEMLVGRGPDDDENWLAWAAKRAAFYPVMAVPMARDAFNVFASGFDYSFTPAQRAINDALIKPIELIGDTIEGEVDPRKAAKVAINSAGIWFNLPTGQVATTVDNVWRAIEEDDFQLRDVILTKQRKD